MARNSYPLGATWDGKGVNFALFSEYATQVDLCLFDMVAALHAEGIEVILDVVYNHTAEGNQMGPDPVHARH